MKSKSTKSEIVGESLQETKTPLSLLAIAKPYTNGYGTLHVIDIYSVPSNIMEIKHGHDVRPRNLDEVRPHVKTCPGGNQYRNMQYQ